MDLDEGDLSDAPFPWHLDLFDGHCHPTDTPSAFDEVTKMKTQALTVMASRRQDQDLVANLAERFPPPSNNADKIHYVVPAFGWHPWFSYQILDDVSQQIPATDPQSLRNEHYSNVIFPSPKDDQNFIASLPELQSLSSILADIRRHLEQHRLALVGEIGLDRAFRIPLCGEPSCPPPDAEDITPGSREGKRLSRYRVELDHQKQILRKQLQLAGEFQRPVSVHGVAVHGVLFETLKESWRGHEKQSKRAMKKQAQLDFMRMDETEDGPTGSKSTERPQPLPYPPRICLHSFSGTPDTLKQYLHPSVPATIFFSFSSLVNFSDRSEKAIAVVEALPDDRILVESDYHRAGEKMDDLMEDIVRKICQIKDWSIQGGIEQLAMNWRRFVYGDQDEDEGPEKPLEMYE